MAADPAPSAEPGRPAWRVLWMLTLGIGLFLYGRDFLQTRWPGDFSIGGVALWGRDFVNVYTSGALTLHHRLDILYDVEAYRAYQLGLFHQSLHDHNYSYPPVTLLYTWLFALLPYPLALVAWLGGTGALFVRAARPYLARAGLSPWLALIAPASIVNLWAGHYGFLVGALWLFAWHHLPKRPVLAGVLIGLMVVKPHLAVLAPLVLLRRGEWRAIAAAAATVALLVGLSALLFGPDLWVTYLTRTATAQVGMVDDVQTFFATMMPTVTTALAILRVPTVAALAAQGVVALLAILILLKYLPKDSERAGLAAATATFLVLPYAFAYDMTVAGLAGVILLKESLGDRRAWFVLAAALAAFLPMAVMWLNPAHLPIAPLLLAFQLAILLGWRRPR
jgi:hypothetical protein